MLRLKVRLRYSIGSIVTISTTTSSVIGIGNGVTSTFDFSFVMGTASNAVIKYIDTDNQTTILSPTQYTLFINPPATGAIWGVGGTVTYSPSSPIPNDSFLLIDRIVPLTQLTTISNQGGNYQRAIESALDTLEMQIQQIANGQNTLFVTTSVTSQTIGLGEFTFTVANNNLAFGPGQFLIVSSNDDPTQYMLGYVISYTNFTLVLEIVDIAGSGTYTPWNISISGPQGPIGPTASVASVSVTSANGFAGTVLNPTTTPAITLSTTVTGILKGNGTAISAAVSGTDYAPATSGSSFLKGNGAGGFTNQSTINLTDLTAEAANTFVANATAGSAAPTASVALSSSQLAGRGSTGNLAAITLGSGLAMTGTTLDVSSSGTGAMVLLSTQTASSSAQIAFTGLSSTYRNYVLYFDDIVPSAGGGADLYCQFSVDNGATYLASLSTYVYAGYSSSEAGTLGSYASPGSAQIVLATSVGGLGQPANDTASGRITLFNPASSVAKRFESVTNKNFSGLTTFSIMGAESVVTTAVNAIRLLFSTGTITSGIFKLYGIL